jgi:hypothetical protein
MIKTFFTRAVSLLFCAVTMLIPNSCHAADSYEVQISGSVTIGDEWVEFHPEQPLKVDKTYQYVYLVLEPPLKDDFYQEGKEPNTGKGILMPDGEVINPEIEVIDQYGNTFNLAYGGAIGLKPKYRLPTPNELPRDRVYKAIRIRSPRQIKCKAIYWLCESSKDWP